MSLRLLAKSRSPELTLVAGLQNTTTAISLSRGWPGSVAEQMYGGLCWWHSFAGHDSVLALSDLHVPGIQDIMPGTNQCDKTAHSIEFCPLSFTSSFFLSHSSFHFLSSGIVPHWWVPLVWGMEHSKFFSLHPFSFEIVTYLNLTLPRCLLDVSSI